jgi:hypothetical protein
MTVKVLANMTRFLMAVAFVKYSQVPVYYISLGVLATFFGITEALIGFWKEIAARVHQPGQPTYHRHRPSTRPKLSHNKRPGTICI